VKGNCITKGNVPVSEGNGGEEITGSSFIVSQYVRWRMTFDVCCRVPSRHHPQNSFCSIYKYPNCLHYLSPTHRRCSDETILLLSPVLSVSVHLVLLPHFLYYRILIKPSNTTKYVSLLSLLLSRTTCFGPLSDHHQVFKN